MGWRQTGKEVPLEHTHTHTHTLVCVRDCASRWYGRSEGLRKIKAGETRRGGFEAVGIPTFRKEASSSFHLCSHTMSSTPSCDAKAYKILLQKAVLFHIYSDAWSRHEKGQGAPRHYLPLHAFSVLLRLLARITHFIEFDIYCRISI